VSLFRSWAAIRSGAPENATAQPPLPALTRILIGPPGKLLIPVAALVGLIALNHASMPGGGPLEWALLGIVLLLGTAIALFARFVVALLRSDRKSVV
jgi:hypothetical protein